MGGGWPWRVMVNCQRSLTAAMLSLGSWRSCCRTTKASRTKATWRTMAASVKHWQAPRAAYCLVSRKMVSTLQRLCLRATTRERSACRSLVGGQALAVAVTVSGHSQPQRAVLGGVDGDLSGAQSKPWTPPEVQPAGQLGGLLAVAVADDGGAWRPRPDAGDAEPAGQAGEPAGGVVGVGDQVLEGQAGGNQLGEHPRGSCSLVWYRWGGRVRVGRH